MKIQLIFKGGPGSGHKGHKGIPGKVGGSLPGTGGVSGGALAGRKMRFRPRKYYENTYIPDIVERTGKYINIPDVRILEHDEEAKTITIQKLNDAGDLVGKSVVVPLYELDTKKSRVYESSSGSGDGGMASDIIAGKLPKEVKPKVEIAGMKDFRAKMEKEYIEGTDPILRSHMDVDKRYSNLTDAERGVIKASVTNHISSDTGISKENVTDVVDQWSLTSNNDAAASLSLQQAVADEFGGSLSDWQRGKLPSAIGDSVLPRSQERAILRSMYNRTQAELTASGAKPTDTVKLYRGVVVQQDYKSGNIVPYTGNAMESWTHDPNMAGFFATGASIAFEAGIPKGSRGYVLSVDIPIGDILSSARTGFGAAIEGEYVVLGGRISNVSIVGEETLGF